MNFRAQPGGYVQGRFEQTSEYRRHTGLPLEAATVNTSEESGASAAPPPLPATREKPNIGRQDADSEVDAYPRFDPRAVWQATLAELALQMPAATYETWVRDTSVIGYEDGEFLIGVPNPYARDWLANRFRDTIKRTLGGIMKRSVQVTFRVRPRPTQDLGSVEAPPLYRSMPDTANQGQSATRSRDGQKLSGSANDEQSSVRSRMWDQQREQPMYTDDQNRASSRYEIYSGTPLNPRYTFETFVVGSHNRLAHAAALSVADHPGERFNPLFVYGGVGLGKTHLLHAIGHQMLNKNLRVLYCSSEQFTNDLISAIRNQSTEEFRNKYREVDLLLIDDIQFIGGKESTQEEFFHTFNHLHAAGRQVVISSDRPPKEIATLEARLRSRFEGGLQVDISQPDLETRVAILQAKAAAMGAEIPTDVLMLVAERVESNIRELEGALNRLILQAPLHGGILNRAIAEEILNNLMPQRRPREPRSVIQIVAEHFRLTPEDITGRTRTKDVALARQVAMYMLREENDLSLPNIGDILGGRDHSTVRYGVEKITKDLEMDEALRKDVLILREKIYAPPGAA
jgi:chromosomal replication initiator protein